MNDSILHIGDYGIGDTRARNRRLKIELGHHGMNGKNGYKYHASLTTDELATYLREWRRFSQHDRLQ